MAILTIGHSTLEIEDFITLLKEQEVNILVDVRSIPASRYAPQFNKENISSALKKQGIGYQHIKYLGGLRHANKYSINNGWKNASFRGYADHMQTEEFEKGIDVYHIMPGKGEEQAKRHALTSFAEVDDGKVSYPIH